MSDARIKSLGNEPDHQEILITSMEIAETGVTDDRITALERKVSAMETPIRGLIEDLLDFKAITRTQSRQNGKPCLFEFTREQVMPDTASQVPADPSASPLVAAPREGSTVIRQQGACHPDVPVAQAGPAMVRIMQSDGTMKMEIRRGDSTPVDGSLGYGRAKNLRC
ncbi:MAG: hypothetical protein ABR999_05470 [Methanoregula sp.]|jgi:hypothetical protein|uniref:hypothetical protein n=1 Tax=Methanoregula sp. TaxID=2052170 RepID=UPI003D11849F